MKQVSLLISILLCLYSCNKDSGDNACQDNSLIRQVISGKNAVLKLTYNSNCAIHESIELFSYKKYTYDSQNKLTKTEVALLFNPASCYLPVDGMNVKYSDPRKAKITQFSTFEYDDAGILIKKSFYFKNNGNDQLDSYQTYEYRNGFIIKINCFNPQGQLNQYITYTYDANGNVTENNDYLIENSDSVNLVITYTYEFDTKNNPYIIYSGEGIPGLYTNKNNILKETMIGSGGETPYQDVHQNVFEYNESGYPVKANGQDIEYGE